MRKKELERLRTLKATPKMMKLAAEDTPQVVRHQRQWGGGWSETVYRYGLYLRCQILKGILKAAIFLPDQMRLGAELPAYELYINRETGAFLTYDRQKEKWLTAKLDMLEWPDYVRHSPGKWINPEGYAAIKRYLGVERGGYPGLLDYQLSVRQEQLRRRHKRETDPWDLDLAQTPELPKDWARWVDKVGIGQHYIFYHYTRRGADHGYCTYCEQEVPIRQPRHNRVGHCPRCRKEITFKAVKKAGTVVTDTTPVYLFQRCEAGVMLREFAASVCYRQGAYETPERACTEIRRSIYDSSVRQSRAYFWGDYKHTAFRWILGSVCQPYWHGCRPGRIYGKTMPDLGRKELSRTGLLECCRDGALVDPEKYLALLSAYPWMEQLAKAGLPRLVEECMDRAHQIQGLFQENRSGGLAKRLGIDAQGLRRMRACRGGTRFLEWLKYEKATGKPLPDQVIAWFSRQGLQASDLRFISDRMSMVQICNYMRRQMAETGMSCWQMLVTWRDYLSMARRFGLDTEDTIIYRVRKLRQRHDEMVKRSGEKDLAIQAGELLEKYPHVEEVLGSLRGIYDFGDEDYTVVVPTRIEEIILEGRALSHCVATSEHYWERIERRESYILFLRRTRDLQKPYYTLEVEPDGTVRQKRTRFDRQEADIGQATGFLRKWQKVVAARLTRRECALAETSRALRARELVQLRQDQVVIHTGHLAGRLLADVLLADLMENTDAGRRAEQPEAA